MTSVLFVFLLIDCDMFGLHVSFGSHVSQNGLWTPPFRPAKTEVLPFTALKKNRPMNTGEIRLCLSESFNAFF